MIRVKRFGIDEGTVNVTVHVVKDDKEIEEKKNLHDLPCYQLLLLFNKVQTFDVKKIKLKDVILKQIPVALFNKIEALENLCIPTLDIYDEFLSLFSKKTQEIKKTATDGFTARVIPAIMKNLNDALILFDLDLVESMKEKVISAKFYPDENTKKNLMDTIEKKLKELKVEDQKSSTFTEFSSSSEEEEENENEKEKEIIVKEIPENFKSLLKIDKDLINNFELRGNIYKSQCREFEKMGEVRLIKFEDFTKYEVCENLCKASSLSGFRGWFLKEMQNNNIQIWGEHNEWFFTLPKDMAPKPLQIELRLLEGDGMKVPVVVIKNPEIVTKKFKKPLLLHCFHDIVLIVTKAAKKANITTTIQSVKKALTHKASGIKFDYNINYTWKDLKDLIKKRKYLLKF